MEQITAGKQIISGILANERLRKAACPADNTARGGVCHQAVIFWSPDDFTADEDGLLMFAVTVAVIKYDRRDSQSASLLRAAF